MPDCWFEFLYKAGKCIVTSANDRGTSPKRKFLVNTGSRYFTGTVLCFILIKYKTRQVVAGGVFVYMLMDAMNERRIRVSCANALLLSSASRPAFLANRRRVNLKHRPGGFRSDQSTSPGAGPRNISSHWPLVRFLKHTSSPGPCKITPRFLQWKSALFLANYHWRVDRLCLRWREEWE